MARHQKWRYWRNLLGFALGVLAVGGLAVVVIFSYQGARVYVHPRRIHLPRGETPARFGVGYRSIRLMTQDGVELSAWYSAPQNGALMLVAHGYGGARSAEMHALFARRGYGVISWDARAHGASGGEASTLGYLEWLDVEAALEFALRQREVRQVGAYGLSMGGATVIRAAAQRREIEAVVADSAFAALEDVVERSVPFPMLPALVQVFAELETGAPARAMRPVDDISRISPRPVFILQGADDQTVPPDSGRRLYAAAGEPRTLWLGAGVEHAGLRAADPDEYDRRLFAFLDASLLEK